MEIINFARLEKEESRSRWRQLRDLWNEFDPIGVYIDDTSFDLDEYSNYCGPCMRLLEQDASREEREACINNALHYLGRTLGKQLRQ